MKKHLLNFILLVVTMIMLPIYIVADTYTESETIVNEYMDRNEYKSSFTKFLFSNATNRYSGMISKEEFDITRYDINKNYRDINFSYLWNSVAYWSSTVEDSKNIPIRNGYKALVTGESTDAIKTKVTQYVKNNVGVYGSGTYSDPWLFAPQYNVRIKVNDDTKGYITDINYNEKIIEDTFVYVKGTGLHYVYIKALGENEYIGSTCGSYIINSVSANKEEVKNESGDVIATNGYLIIDNISRDTECMINFGERPRTIKLDQTNNDTNSNPPTLYMLPEKGWFNDIYGNEQIYQINTNPKKIGYNYNGYYYLNGKTKACDGIKIIETDKKLNYKLEDLEKLENNTKLYPCYSPITYYVAYNCPKGEAKADNPKVEHIYDVAKNLESDRCTREGYDLTSWNTKEDGTGSSYGIGANVQGIYDKHGETLNLYSQWTAKTNIKYTVNHYIQNVANDEYTLKETETEQNGVSDAMKTFEPKTYDGFTSPSNQTVSIKPDGSTVVNFYYTRNSYKVTFNANGYGTPNPTSYTIKYEANYKLPSISAKGYTLNGWFSESTGGTQITESTKVTKTSDHTIYARWNANTYTVKHSCGTGSGTVANITATFDKTFTSASKSCTKRGYVQNGWTTKNNETDDGYGWSNKNSKWTYVNGEYGISNGILQLYPLWKANTYTVKYSCGNTASQTVTYNSSFSIAGYTCTKKGYTQIGWTTNSGGTDDGHGWSGKSGTWEYINGQYGITSGTLQLYPRWQANTYTIKYSCGTGSGSVASQSVKYDATVTIAKLGCTKNGYAFAGWTTNSNETNDGYSWTNWSGTWKYDNGENGISNRTLQLYPRWTQCQAGYYSSNGTCQKCGEGTYSTAGSASCTACPAGSYCSDGSKYACPSGYTSNTNSKTINDCYINVSAGKYIASSGSSTQSTCQAGKYKTAHTVYYGSTSSCSTCPSGYTSDSGATAQNKCFVSVSAGKYIGTVNSATQTNCAVGKYKEAHTVYYGSTSSCSTCPSGYTSTSGATAQNKCFVSVSAGKYIGTANSATQTNCAAGKYKEAHTVYYGSTSSCSTCPSGYTSAAAATAQNKCFINVSENKYIATAGSSTQTSCAAGKTSAAHTVYYGNTSSCTACTAGTYSASGGSCTTCTAGYYCTSGVRTACPDGYTSAAGAKTINECYISVSAGKYIATANSATQTSCAIGYYKTAHTVNYGSTSSCSQCPSGYRDGAGATAQSNCKRSVAAGNYIASANATSNTACATGYYKTAHTVNYGSTSSCSQCPSGYRNGAGATAQSNCKRSVAAGNYIASANATTNTACATGYYKAAHTVNYGSTSSCSQCPSGYRDGAGATAQSNCKRSVAAGYYIASANATSNTACATGYYKTAHTVNYGSTSSCSQCPSGYRNGAGATAQSNCKRSVAAGYYIASANATSNTACATGYYKTAHTVNYGSTSSCSQCPSGYRNGAGATAQSNCKRSVAAGNYIASANATTNTACATGYYKAAHTVNYGSTSSCSQCPSGYRDGAGATSQSNCKRSVSGGYYIASANATSNTICPAGKYKAAHTVNYGSTSSCSSCPSGTTSPQGSDASSDCETPKVTYTATFNKNGASSIGSTSLSCTAEQGSSCTVKAPTITAASGFTVLGWNTSAGAIEKSVSVGGTITLTSNKTYYAITRYSTSTYKTATFQVVDSSGATRTSLTGTYTNNYGNIYKTVTCYRYNGSSTEYKCKAPTQIHIYARTEFGESLFDFGGWSTTTTSQSKAFGANDIFTITANKTYYQISKLKSVYYSSSVYGTSLGTNFRSSLSGSTFEGLNLGHRLQPSSWRFYTGESSCYNYIWIYGTSLNEGWSGYGCSWYLGLKSRSAQ